MPLALLHYRDEGARPMSDADVLVKPTDLVRAVHVLEAKGWTPRTAPPEWPPEPRASWPFGDGERELDLHWRVFSVGFLPDDALWAASVPFSVAGAPTRALAPADQLLHVIVHGLQWNPLPSIRWIADAVVVMRCGGAALDWDRLIAQATARTFVPALTAALEYLDSRFDVAVPSCVLERLRAHPSSRRERVELWARLSPGVVGAGARLWFDYRRLAREGRPALTKPSVRRYLQRRWMLAEDAVLPMIVTRKVVGRWARSHERG